MQSSFILFFIIIGLLFGVWSRYSEFYPTLLFWIIGNLTYDTVLHHYRVWVLHPVWIDHLLIPTHLTISLAIAFIIYPFAIPVYLGRFPKSLFKKIGWILLWVFVFQAVETIAYLNKSISYHHGWSLYWSFILNIVTFSVLPIHKWKPWVAWLLSVVVIIFLFNLFHPPVPK